MKRFIMSSCLCMQGGGLLLDYGATAVLTDCEIYSNTAIGDVRARF